MASGQRVFSRYVLESLLGRGGMSVVWRAWDETLEENVALKFLPDVVARDDTAVEDLKDETRRARRLTHDNIVRVHDFVQEPGLAAVSMEYVDGDTLAKKRLQQPGKVYAISRLAPLVAQLCSALEYAHSHAKIIHRDLKPANVLSRADGHLKVTDFGIARGLTEASSRLTGKAGRTSGTLLYVSPQQLLGDPPVAADDIYSLGATIFELLTGKPPFFRGDAHSLMMQVREKLPSTLAAQRQELDVRGETVPREWEDVVRACLAKRVEDRPRTARQVAESLKLHITEGKFNKSETPVSTDEPVTASVLTSYPLGSRRPAGVWARVSLGCILVLLASGFAYILGYIPLPRPWLGEEFDVAKIARDLFRSKPPAPTVEQAPVAAPPKPPPLESPKTAMVLTIKARPDTTVRAIDRKGQARVIGVVGAAGSLPIERPPKLGQTTLRFVHPDCLDVELSDIDLSAANVTELAPVQSPLPAEIRVQSLPAGASVWIDERLVGVTPVTVKALASERKMHVELRLRGYRNVAHEVTLKPRENHSLNVGALTAENGSIHLRISGFNAGRGLARLTVSVDGSPVQNPSWQNQELLLHELEVGEHSLEVRHPDYETWRRVLTIRDRETITASVALTARQ